MAPPSATAVPEDVVGTSTHEAGASKTEAAIKGDYNFPAAPTFEDKYKEREYQKGRLALAFRIFAHLGFDEGVAGHITLRVSGLPMAFAFLRRMERV